MLVVGGGYLKLLLILSISEFECCESENDSYAENIRCCLLITIENGTVVQTI